MKISLHRRAFLATAVASAAGSRVSLFAQDAPRQATLTKEQRDRMSPDVVLEELRRGNERFRSGQMIARDYRAQQRSTAAGQFPMAAMLGCVDSRAPGEIIFDTGIGDTFNAR